MLVTNSKLISLTQMGYTPCLDSPGTLFQLRSFLIRPWFWWQHDAGQGSWEERWYEKGNSSFAGGFWAEHEAENRPNSGATTPAQVSLASPWEVWPPRPLSLLHQTPAGLCFHNRLDWPYLASYSLSCLLPVDFVNLGRSSSLSLNKALGRC